VLLCVVLFLFSSLTIAQGISQVVSADSYGTTKTSSPEIEELKSLLKEQQQQLNQMRAVITEQARAIEELNRRVGPSTVVNSPAPEATTDKTGQGGPQRSQSDQIAQRVARVEEQSKKTAESLEKQLGSIAFSGDLRLQLDSIHNQLDASANAQNPAILGNKLAARNRLRLRARLGIQGRIDDQFDWGIRLATGLLDDPISSNQILTDFYDRKQFALDRAFIRWSPRQVPGLQIIGGKFEPPWLRTEMTIDRDINVEGVAESYTRSTKSGPLRELSLVAWQLPFLERNSVFVRNSNGTPNPIETRRAGRDLALYGAQARTKFSLGSNTALTLSAADLYYSGTQFITPIQFFGNQLQVTATTTIPATSTTPAQTLTSLVLIPRDFFVAGGNLGVSTASNNAINRDGHLSSGFNLVDLIGRLDLFTSKRFPVGLLYNLVVNTQTRDVVRAAANGSNELLPNHENLGQWAEVLVGRDKERGDMSFGYTFMRIQKDAVLTPFNFSEVAQQSDMRAQRIQLTYTTNPHVVLTFTGLFTKRSNGLFGPFVVKPAGSLNPLTSRFQFDTTFRF
jgi:hypothetical protein